MSTPPRLVPLLEQFDWAGLRLINRMMGPEADSGTGTPIPVTPMSDEEYRWEPVPGCWSVRRRADGPGKGANVLRGAGEWGRDSAEPVHPYPPPFTTIAWRLSHISEMLTLRADYTVGGHDLTSDSYQNSGDAAGAVMAFGAAAQAWREVLISCDDATLDIIGLSTYPYGSDAEDVFIDIVWWVNQEILHHGAEIALLRDLYRARGGMAGVLWGRAGPGVWGHRLPGHRRPGRRRHRRRRRRRRTLPSGEEECCATWRSPDRKPRIGRENVSLKINYPERIVATRRP